MLSLHDQILLEFKKIVPQEEFNKWLASPNSKLNFKTPNELLTNKNYQPLWHLLFRSVQ